MVVELLELEKDWNVDDIVAGVYVDLYFSLVKRRVCADTKDLKSLSKVDSMIKDTAMLLVLCW